MSRYWSDRVHQLKPYVPGEQPKLPRLIKLNTNENPFGPSEAVRSAIAAVADEDLRLYPDPESTALRETIAGYHGIRADQVFVGNGSDEILAHIFQAFFARDQVLRFPDITYSFYPVYCGLYGIEYRTVPLDDDFAIDPEDYRDASGGVIFPNPNAPTGRALPLADVEAIVAANPDSVVVVDEAYVDFGAESAIALVGRYPNVLVSQTLSKSRSLAGLRVGFAVGHEDLIEGLNRVKNSFNSYPVDRLANAGAMASFQDEAGFQRTRQAVIEERERLAAALRELGFEVVPSAANFVFTRHSQFAGKALADTLRDQGIIVRHFDKPRIGDFLRITVGRPDQTDALIRALAAAVS